MNAKARPRFDVDTLRALAGDKVFARGKDYHCDGLVELLNLEPERVVARVSGTEDYRTVLTGRETRLNGECSCPAFEDWGFCKHMVATALAANAAAEDGAPESADTFVRIRQHLKARGVDALVELVMELAERDMALLQRLELAAAAASEDDVVLERRLRKAINDATGTDGFIPYHEASEWADGVDRVLDSIEALLSAGRAALALKVAGQAIARIEQAAQEMDDSAGHCGALLHRAAEIHLTACHAAPPDPVELARDLFDRELEDEHDAFHRAMIRYADVLGEAGLAEYRRLATEAWEKLPARAGGPRAAYGDVSNYASLASIVDFFAEGDGDVDARIAIRAKNLSSPWDYRQLVEFCAVQGRREEALRYAEEGLWLFEDAPPNLSLVNVTAELLIMAGRRQEAEAHLWRAFERTPELETYKRLRKLGGKDARERAIALLKEQQAKEKRHSWRPSATVLIEILIAEKLFDAAWAAVRDYGASIAVQQELARASEASHPQQALEVYAGQVEHLVKLGGNANYKAACKLVGRMRSLRDSSAQATYVADLKKRYQRRRNFMKLMG